MTPFGFPVVPDVYRTNSGSVASIASGSHQSSAFAIASCHQMSRPSFIGTGSFIRWNTTTCFTMDRSAIASSTAFFSGTTLPRRSPPRGAGGLEPVRELVPPPPQRVVREHLLVPGLALPDDRGLVPERGLQVAVQAVLGDVDPPAHAPLRERLAPPPGPFPPPSPPGG